MSRVYFEGWYSGCYAKAEDWYTDNLVYLNIRFYSKSTVFDRPDSEKSFLLSIDKDRIREYEHSIVNFLIGKKESRDPVGRLIPISITLPKQLS